MGRRSVEEHAARVAALLAPVLTGSRSERVALDRALGRVTATDLRSPLPLPPFRNSQMDGYAARAADIAAPPVVLPVAGVQPAGPSDLLELPLGAVLKVMTGAPLPLGADCVVPVEDTEPGPSQVAIRRSRSVGEYVRDAGSDLAAGNVVVGAGTRLAPRHLAALAAAGLAEVPVLGLPRVAVLTTGEEVVQPGEPLRFGQVYDANLTAVTALVREAGAEVVLADRTADDPDAFRRALETAAASADLVLTCGGISHGDYEVVRQVLEPLGADVTEVA
ncbi:MAG: molybdopterin molybdotransferase, partial [Microbacteriaceae bacterium]|nr:molybdopterin molybdotransferase [Microbacteriaceae bacterium]